MPDPTDHTALLFRGLEFASEKHRHQRRKDSEASPYINHPIQVAGILAGEGGIDDTSTLVAAILHDTLEDTDTTPEEVEENFGPEVRMMVEEVTDDKNLPKTDRKRLQVENSPRLSPEAKLIRTADKISNLRDLAGRPPKDWPPERRGDYIEWTRAVMKGCRGINPSLEKLYDDTAGEARRALEKEERK